MADFPERQGKEKAEDNNTLDSSFSPESSKEEVGDPSLSDMKIGELSIPPDFELQDAEESIDSRGSYNAQLSSKVNTGRREAESVFQEQVSKGQGVIEEEYVPTILDRLITYIAKLIKNFVDRIIGAGTAGKKQRKKTAKEKERREKAQSPKLG